MRVRKLHDRAGYGVLASAIAATLAGGAFTTSAYAQDETQVDEITVTGTRIMRRDNVSNSPLVTVEQEVLENRTGLNIESYLNQLPEYNPAASPVTTQSDVQISAVNSVGISAVSLRGFGANRNLVLVDGHRQTPTNAMMVVDINGIPSALIQRVEIISGGASAVYGADAIGGVTNFILRDDFEGLELDAQSSITEAGDGEEFRFSSILGSSVAEGRGNITIGAEYYERKEALQRERKFYTEGYADPTTGGTGFGFLFGLNGYNTGFFAGPSQSAMTAVFGSQPTCAAGIWGCNLLTGFRFNADGKMYNPNGTYSIGSFTGTIDGQEYARQRSFNNTQSNVNGSVPDVIDTLKWNNLEALVSAPQERYSFFASGKYDITDSIEFFARATYAESETKTRLFGTNASFGWEAQVPYNPTTDSPINPTAINSTTNAATISTILGDVTANGSRSIYWNPGFIAHGQTGAQHPVPAEFAAMLNSRGNQAGNWIMETYPDESFPQRSTVNVNNVWQIETGLRYDLPFGDWTGESYVSHGQTSTYNVAYGNNSLERWRKAIRSADYGRNQTFFGNEDGASVNFGTVPVSCTSGFYEMIFLGDQTASEDCRYAVTATLQTRTQNQQQVFEQTFQGGLFDLPAGQVRSALGFQWRRNSAQFNPDVLQSTASFEDQVIGVYPTGYLDKSMTNKDVFGELLIPVVADLPFAKKIELDTGARYSTYSATDDTFTYKINLSWEINDSLRLRGGYNRATRAPNLGELFLNLQEVFGGGGRFGDPCGLASDSPFGAGGAQDINGVPVPDPDLVNGPAPALANGQTQAGANSTYLICRAQMNLASATAANTYYGQNAGGRGGDVFAWTFQEGNAGLDSEKADTWTAGLVFASQSSNPWLANLQGAIDWWKVDIEDAIQQYSSDYARWLCYGQEIVNTTTAAQARAASEGCRNVGRTASGGVATRLLSYDNSATISTSGIDVSLNWFGNFADLGAESLPGGLGLNLQATVLDYYKTKQSPEAFDVETDWKGSLGPTLTGTNAGAYSYRLNLGLSYMVDNYSFSLRGRYLPSVWGAAHASEKAVIANNERVAAGGDGIILGYTPSTALKVKSYAVLDFSFNWNVNDTFSVRAGVDNVLDVQPRITAASTGRPSGDLSLVCSAAEQALGCLDPTSYSLGSTGQGTTSAGYYDTLGRRFFLGVKARF